MQKPPRTLNAVQEDNVYNLEMKEGGMKKRYRQRDRQTYSHGTHLVCAFQQQQQA